jgi:hypothetical protein
VIQAKIEQEKHEKKLNQLLKFLQGIKDHVGVNHFGMKLESTAPGLPKHSKKRCGYEKL